MGEAAATGAGGTAQLCPWEQRQQQTDMNCKNCRHTVFEIPMFCLMTEMVHAQSASKGAAQKCNGK